MAISNWSARMPIGLISKGSVTVSKLEAQAWIHTGCVVPRHGRTGGAQDRGSERRGEIRILDGYLNNCCLMRG